MSNTDPCIISLNDDQHNKTSAVMFNDKYILTTATILANVLTKDVEIITKYLESMKVIDVTNDTNFKNLKLKTCSVTYRKRDGTNLQKSMAYMIYIFNCKNIEESINQILDGFKPKALLNATMLCEEDFLKILVSSFVILKVSNYKQFHKIKGSAYRLNDDLIQELYDIGLLIKTEKQELIIKSKNINKLDDVATVTTPFANENFFSTINIGKISNILGRNDCLIVISVPLTYGCEGGAVYNNKQELIGIIINTTFNWKNEIANLTLAATINEILKAFLEQTQHRNIKLINYKPNTSVIGMEKYVVLVQTISSWGTGCMVKIHNKKMVITCSHVVNNNNNNITCFWNKNSFSCSIIYKNPHFNIPFDVAVLDVPATIPDKYFAPCNTETLKIGELIYSVGFPHFSTLATLNFSPSIYEGKITKISDGLFFTDASVQTGQSGGPLFNEYGQLIGVSVSNIKHVSCNLIYPNINMTVPIMDIYNILEKFAISGDIKYLDQIIANKNVKRIWNLERSIVSKL